MDEERQARIAAILERSAELTQRTEEMLAEPRPAMTYDPPRQVKAYDAERLEQMLHKRLLAVESRLSLRIDALEGRLQGMLQGVEGLADEAGGALGQAEKRLREEIKKAADALRGELTMLRSEKAGTPQRRQKATSRAPWKDIDAFIAN
jgi:hypothetical protein